MITTVHRLFWLAPADPADPYAVAGEASAFVRLWLGFMTARVMLAGVLLLLQLSVHWLGQPMSPWLIGLCGAYLAAALAVRLVALPHLPRQALDPQWVATIGVDLVAFSALQFLQAGGFNYTPLFALPVLLGSVLGSPLLALGTAASVTLLLLVDAWLTSLQLASDSASRFLQSGLTGTGFFVLALLTSQMAGRLAREEQRSWRSQLAARVQSQVNELVVENLGDGVLVVDSNGVARSANPAARRLLGPERPARSAPFVLAAEPAWQPLVELAHLTFTRHAAQTGEVAITHAGQNPRRVQVRTRLTAESSAERLCVMFLQDQRELEARLRTEKLAAMGRMSAAVAHEIRNPLAAIAQANALLDEDIRDAEHKRLTQMVGQNVQRLARIVEEVLDISRVQHRAGPGGAPAVDLDESVRSVCADWGRQTGGGARLRVSTGAAGLSVVFEPEHLRRVLVNLLDNALRYAGQRENSIQVSTRTLDGGTGVLQVWSDGAPLEFTVQQHLFEPFFSSESRSSGLGLYICRELCERHGAMISYQRAPRSEGAAVLQGNEFFVEFRATATPSGLQPPLDAASA